MEKEKKKGKGLIVLIVFLFLIIIGLIGYICYDKGVFDSLLGRDKQTQGTNIEDSNDVINNDVENTKYQFDLSEIKCTEVSQTMCQKTVKVSYNNENHNIKIMSLKEKNNDNYSDIKVTHKIYIDDKEFYTIEGGSYPSEFDAGENWDFAGYIYIFDDTNLGFVLPNYLEKRGYDGTFLTAEGKIIKRLNLEAAWTSFGVDDTEDLDSITNLEFDGHMLKVWDIVCNDDTMDTAIQIGITINNGELILKKIDTKNKVKTSGQGGCKINNATIS